MSTDSESLNPGHPPPVGGVQYFRNEERPNSIEVYRYRNAARPLDGLVVLTRIGQLVRRPFRWISRDAGGDNPWYRSSERYMTLTRVSLREIQ